MRCRTKLDFAETYCFGHNSCNSGLFLLKMGLNERIFKGYYLHNQLQLVQISLVALFEKHATATASPVRWNDGAWVVFNKLYDGEINPISMSHNSQTIIYPYLRFVGRCSARHVRVLQVPISEYSYYCTRTYVFFCSFLLFYYYNNY